MAEDDVPLLRADATDDQDELEPELRMPPHFAEGGVVTTASNGDDTIPFKLLAGDSIIPKKLADKLAIPDSEDNPDDGDGTVDPASPGATSANGVIHGGR